MSPHTPQIAGSARSVRGGAAADQEATPLISLTDITEIELLILRRMREMTIGDHRSLAHGSGFDYVGLRDWQAGDRFSTIDWAQSSLTNFSPLVVREFEQPSTASVIVVADQSASTRCGVNGVPIARGVARAIATVGMSAVFFQDLFGLITFDAEVSHLAAVRPRIGRNQVIHCLDAYQHGTGAQELRSAGSVSMTIGSFMRKTALIPFVSDFLFEDRGAIIRELTLLNSAHDVFVILIDAAFAFQMPPISAGWVETIDVESGRTRLMSRRAFAELAERVARWQDETETQIRGAGLDVVRIGPESAHSDLALAEFVGERRLRKVA
jgi:uncharacterized protein (DUF58 family)